MEELLIVSDNCDGVGVMKKRGTCDIYVLERAEGWEDVWQRMLCISNIHELLYFS